MERGTPPRRSSKGKAPGYSPKRGEAVYKAHRVNSCKPRKDREKKKCYGTSISDRPEIAAIRIPGKTSKAVMDAMAALRAEYGQHFPQVFKTITADNGSEFAGFAQTEAWGSKVFFAHPYTSWERAQNERHNGLFRSFVPKGVSIELFTDEDILAAADELNGRPRRTLGYCTPEELFEALLNTVYTA